MIENIYKYIVGDIYRYILGDIYRYSLGDIYRNMVEDIYRYILGYIYIYMVGYLQIYNKGYLYIINPIVSEMVIGAEGRYRIHACLICLTFFVKQLDIICSPAMTTLSTHPLQHFAPGYYHAAHHGGGDGQGPPHTLLPTTPLVNVVLSLKPTSSKLCTDAIFNTCSLQYK